MELPKSPLNRYTLSWLLFLLVFVGLLLKTTTKALAIVPVQYATHSATITATVPEELYSAPTLISPNNGSVTNQPNVIFSWNEATSTAGIDHYFFYYDGSILIDHIPNNAATWETDQYKLTHSDGVFTLQFKFVPADGYHTWQVDAYTNGDKTLASETRNYLLDTTNPIIILTQVGQTEVYWASNDSQSIPPANERNFIINQDNVLLKGKYEANSNLKITLVCQNISNNCVNQSITINNSSGLWENIFRNLTPSSTYNVYIAAVDSAGNLTNFPTFTITYRPIQPLIFLINIFVHYFPKPTPTPTPIPSPTPEVVLPTPLPPLSPTPVPVSVTPTPTPLITSTQLGWLFVWGLLAHLAMAVFGAGVGILYIGKFIFRVFWPKTKSNYYTESWATLTYYDANSLHRPLRIDFGAITGRFGYPKYLPQTVFIKVTKPGFMEGKFLADINRLPQTLRLKTDEQASLWIKFKTASLALRILPLFIAIGSSLVAFWWTKQWYYGAYLYLSLHFFFAEYLYPSVSK